MVSVNALFMCLSFVITLWLMPQRLRTKEDKSIGRGPSFFMDCFVCFLFVYFPFVLWLVWGAGVGRMAGVAGVAADNAQTK